MKKLLAIALLVMVYTVTNAQTYSRVRVNFANETQQKAFFALPIAHDHGTRKANQWFESDFSDWEINQIAQAGIPYQILIPNVSEYYKNRNQTKSGVPKSNICDDLEDIQDPQGFTMGSMAGFFTYEEFLGHLDNMATLYPNLITVKQPISTFQTWENRPIYWLKISDNPNTDENNEPEVLYTAIHHAREPASLSQLIYFMYYVLENYDNDINIKNLVDNRELYFVPMLNPDGYVYNQTIEPNGGGMWRKNRRNNNNGTFGVDLNRNYEYNWAGPGTSADGNSDVYHGPGPFSEPETQAIKWFTEQHNFVTALNYHSFSDLLLFPWGDADIQCVDHDNFTVISADMVERNGYANIQSSLLYPTGGSSDDWMYGDTLDMPRVYAMTPEVGSGNDGFWPQDFRIFTLCKENVDANIKNALNAGNYYVIGDLEPFSLTNQNYYKYSVTRLGWGQGPVTVTFTNSEGFTSFGPPKTYNNLAIGQTVVDSVACSLVQVLIDGQPISYTISINNGEFDWVETRNKVYGTPNQVFANAGVTTGFTGNNTWGTSSTIFFSGPTSITDSPNGNYPDNSTRTLRTSNPISLIGFDYAKLVFKARWDIEPDYDFAQVSISTDGTNWEPLCGKYTRPGADDQILDSPIYDGTQLTWVDEEMDISGYVGLDVYFRFLLRSDQAVDADGIYIDDIKVIALDNKVSVNLTDAELGVNLYPNPANNLVMLSVPQNNVSYTLTNVMGQTLATGQFNQSTLVDVATLSPGIYFVQVATPKGNVTKRFVKE